MNNTPSKYRVYHSTTRAYKWAGGNNSLEFRSQTTQWLRRHHSSSSHYYSTNWWLSSLLSRQLGMPPPAGHHVELYITLSTSTAALTPRLVHSRVDSLLYPLFDLAKDANFVEGFLQLSVVAMHRIIRPCPVKIPVGWVFLLYYWTGNSMVSSTTVLSLFRCYFRKLTLTFWSPPGRRI